MKLLATTLIILITIEGQILSGNIIKGKVEDFFYNKREHVVILKFENEGKETKTISIGLFNRGTLMENWDSLSIGDSIYYEPQSDTLNIIKKDDNKLIKVYFKNRSKKMKL
ncbi:hypothetical protein BZG01_10920 [Labilibaculum manganireducens]|uniref:Uncharacterized protein n=1 Tax=Labilibaculum manganireducens TaxID=1940525 RepID=A0A2N3I8B4_9BACT|nr:hypothetical protein [Labilibaculum manganireducens]PKQ66529.1 hypothetical protein BZG01_10920 [Labilibaculum manganireducens]